MKEIHKLQRPKIEKNRPEFLQKIGLIVDSTTIKTYKPMGNYLLFFKSLRKIWRIKKMVQCKKRNIWKEKKVAILGSSSHQAMFISKKEPASVHNFSLYQKNIKIYSLYLKATKKDRELGLKEQEYWNLLLDKGYIGEVPGGERALQ